MSERILSTKSLPEALFQLIQTDKVVLRQEKGEIHLIPIPEPLDHITQLRGSLAAYPEMSVDRFLQRKHFDKEIEQ